jgi:hypothetical protein
MMVMTVGGINARVQRPVEVKTNKLQQRRPVLRQKILQGARVSALGQSQLSTSATRTLQMLALKSLRTCTRWRT